MREGRRANEKERREKRDETTREECDGITTGQAKGFIKRRTVHSRSNSTTVPRLSGRQLPESTSATRPVSSVLLAPFVTNEVGPCLAEQRSAGAAAFTFPCLQPISRSHTKRERHAKRREGVECSLPRAMEQRRVIQLLQHRLARGKRGTAQDIVAAPQLIQPERRATKPSAMGCSATAGCARSGWATERSRDDEEHDIFDQLSSAGPSPGSRGSPARASCPRSRSFSLH